MSRAYNSLRRRVLIEISNQVFTENSIGDETRRPARTGIFFSQLQMFNFVHVKQLKTWLLI